MSYKKALEAIIKQEESDKVYDKVYTGDWFTPVEFDLNQKKLNQRVAYWLKQGKKK